MTETAMELGSQALGIVGWIIVGIVALLAIISIFKERFNAFYCILLGVGSFFVTRQLNIFAQTGEFEVDILAIIFAVMVGAWILIRFLPLIMSGCMDTETSTYLVLGTLLESTEATGCASSLLKCIGTLILAGLLGFGTYFLMNFALCNGLYFIGYIISSLLTAGALAAFIKSFFSYY